LRRIEALISEPGPFIWRASRTAMTSIPLGWPHLARRAGSSPPCRVVAFLPARLDLG
jgi:hypothetical protein